jgi:hypothetical protein
MMIIGSRTGEKARAALHVVEAVRQRNDRKTYTIGALSRLNGSQTFCAQRFGQHDL